MPLTRRPVSLLLALTLTLAACGGDDDGADPGDTADRATTTTAVDPGGESGGDSGAGFGEAIEATVALSGAVEQTYALGDGEIILGGGCQGTRFGVQIQVRDAAGSTAVNAQVDVDEDLTGGVTGTFPADPVLVQVFGDEQTTYRGAGEMTITAHDAADALNDRRIAFELEAPGLEGSDGALDFSATSTWVMGCP
jgi:hypothetical protein